MKLILGGMKKLYKKKINLSKAIEEIKPIHERIKFFRKKYKLANNAHNNKIIQKMLYKDFGIKVKFSNIDINKSKDEDAHYVKGFFAEIIGLLHHKAYLTGVIDTIKEIEKHNALANEGVK